MIWSARAAGIQLSINGVNLQRYQLAGVARFLICLIAVCADIQLNQTRSLTLCNDNNKVSTSNYKTNIRIVIIWFAYCTAGFNRCRKRSQFPSFCRNSYFSGFIIKIFFVKKQLKWYLMKWFSMKTLQFI